MANRATKLTDLTIIDAIERKDLFGPWFKKRFFQAAATWGPWLSFLKVLFGLSLDEQDIELFQQCTSRNDIPESGFTECWLVCGRRAGKSFIISLVAVFLACFVDWKPYLQHGEVGTVAICARDRAQCLTIFRYILRLLEGVRVLKPLIVRQTNELIELSNGINIEITTASYQTIRGRTLIAALLDEVAFWQSEGSNPDSAVLSAIRPALGTVPGSMLLCASSPYARKGVLFDHHARYFGKNGSDTLIWQSATRTMNPTFSQRTIDAATEKDPADARAEYYAEFRDDVSGWADRALIEAAVQRGVTVRAPLPGITYKAFADPSGGSKDSFTAAVAHAEGNDAILDCLIEVRAPFNPDEAVAQIADVLKSYGVRRCVSDRYAAQWPVAAFARHGITLAHSERDRSQIYLDALPLFTTGRCRLLDNEKLVTQFAGLVRTTSPSGRDKIDHGKTGADDLCNSAAGAMVLTAAPNRRGAFAVSVAMPGTSDDNGIGSLRAFGSFLKPEERHKLADTVGISHEKADQLAEAGGADVSDAVEYDLSAAEIEHNRRRAAVLGPDWRSKVSGPLYDYAPGKIRKGWQ
jgi:hypothetical protein